MMQFRHIWGAFTSDDDEEFRSGHATSNTLYSMQP